MNYLFGVASRFIAVVITIYLLYTIFWQLPFYASTYMPADVGTMSKCSKEFYGVCQYIDGWLIMTVWMIGLSIIFALLKILMFIFVPPVSKEEQEKIDKVVEEFKHRLKNYQDEKS